MDKLRVAIRKNLQNILTEVKTKSTDFNTVSEYLKRSGFDPEDFFGDDHTLKIQLNLKNKNKLSKTIDVLDNLYGWYLSGAQEDFHEPIENDVNSIKSVLKTNIDDLGQDYEPDDMILLMHFEPKYSTTVPGQNIPDVLFHVTDEKYLDKIKKHGLIPKHKDKLSYHPDRIYFLIDKSNVEQLVNNYNFNIDTPVLLTINVSAYKNNNVFYTDPNMPGGIYTTNNIPPNLIISTENI